MTVNVINLSEYIWPKEVWVDMVKPLKKVKFTPYKIPVQLRPGEQGGVTLVFQAPKEKGKYHLIFGLRGKFEKK